jgi:asparagine synthase (glutamine-hydrolysing)
MTVDFALVAGSAEAVGQLSLDRFKALNTGGGTAHVSGAVRIWVSAEAALETKPGLLLAGDVALDNRAALCARLGLSPEESAPQVLSDLPLVCRLVAQEGAEALTQLSGRFALLLWEDQTENLTVIRDHYGLQPVYKAEDAGQLLVASDLKLLAHLRATPLVPRADSVFRFMTGTSDAGTETAWEGLNRLPSATQLRWTPEQSSTEDTYWKQEMPPLGPLQDAVGGLRDHLRRAVQVRMDAGQWLGYMLSGGLDSSTLVMLAAEKPEALPLSTLSFVYRDTDAYDESAFICAFAFLVWEIQGHGSCLHLVNFLNCLHAPPLRLSMTSGVSQFSSLGLSWPRPPRPPRPGVLARPEVMSLEDDLGTTVAAEAAISLCIRSTPW